MTIEPPCVFLQFKEGGSYKSVSMTDLISAIDLAESALEDAIELLQISGYSTLYHQQALSEIKKLKGE